MQKALLGLALIVTASAGCHNEPPPPRVPVPSSAYQPSVTYGRDPAKPMPSQRVELSTMASATTSPSNRFLDAYDRVGHPHIALFINKSIDQRALDIRLLDALSFDGRVTIVSPENLRQKLSARQIDDLNSGKKEVVNQLATQADADVLVHVHDQAQGATRSVLVAEAVDTRRAESLGRAEVDFTPPLDLVQIGKTVPPLVAKLTDQVAGTWTGH